MTFVMVGISHGGSRHTSEAFSTLYFNKTLFITLYIKSFIYIYIYKLYIYIKLYI